MIPNTAAIAEYEEQVSSFLRRSNSKAEGMSALNAHAASLLANLEALLPAIQESPAYAGIAFYGRFQAVKLPLIKRLAAGNVPSQAALDAIREGKALRVAASAKSGWDLLLQRDPDALWAAIYLNLCTQPVSVRVAKVKASDDAEALEDESDEVDDDESDEDDDN